jgi:hypothetical protein
MKLKLVPIYSNHPPTLQKVYLRGATNQTKKTFFGIFLRPFCGEKKEDTARIRVPGGLIG